MTKFMILALLNKYIYEREREREREGGDQNLLIVNISLNTSLNWGHRKALKSEI